MPTYQALATTTSAASHGTCALINNLCYKGQDNINWHGRGNN